MAMEQSETHTAPTVWQDVYDATIASALQIVDSVDEIKHSVVKGSIREILLDELIRPMLPRTYGVGTGVIVDFDGGIVPAGAEDNESQGKNSTL